MIRFKLHTNNNTALTMLGVFLFVFFSSVVSAQDKLFLKNGEIIKCKITALSEKTISYRDTVDFSLVNTISKSEVVLAEYKSGAIYTFNLNPEGIPTVVNYETREQRKERKMKEWKKEEELLSSNIIGVHIPDLLFGRFTLSYERLIANKSLGVLIPASISYDMSRAIGASTGNNFGATNTGIGFIGGVDVNYYFDLKPEFKYYFGPRVRYGRDMTLGGIEGLTVQLQNGFFKSAGKNVVSSFGWGFGFFKLSERYMNMPGYEPNQVYPWASFTYRLAFRL
jgi:hypothetical protein